MLCGEEKKRQGWQHLFRVTGNAGELRDGWEATFISVADVIRIERDKSSLADWPIGKTTEVRKGDCVLAGRKESIPDAG